MSGNSASGSLAQCTQYSKTQQPHCTQHMRTHAALANAMEVELETHTRRRDMHIQKFSCRKFSRWSWDYPLKSKDTAGLTDATFATRHASPQMPLNVWTQQTQSICVISTLTPSCPPSGRPPQAPERRVLAAAACGSRPNRRRAPTRELSVPER